jgi:hypothetical protein
MIDTSFAVAVEAMRLEDRTNVLLERARALYLGSQGQEDDEEKTKFHGGQITPSVR